jgi:hypothetical protein
LTEEDTGAAIRVCLDVNIWIAHLVATQSKRDGGSASRATLECEAGPVRLAMSWKMLSPLESVLDRLGFDRRSVADFTAALVGIMKAGPEQFDPYLLPEGGGSFPLVDAEDRASSIAARVNMLRHVSHGSEVRLMGD